ncbi:MAG TPA: TonB-dependent receptor [Oleiagrimonas sp.]|nr:TonB-dependent receptor [Oleiagrimonas sp.]
MSTSIQRGLKHLPLAIAVIAALQIAPAFAHGPSAANQQSDQSTDQSNDQSNDQSTTNQQNNDQTDNVQTMNAVTVTGSLLQRPEYQTTVPIQEINVEAAKKAGAFSAAGMVQMAAVAAGSTQINNQFSGYIVSGGTGVQTINLRGLGPNRTLVLLDGQRPGPGGTRGQVGAVDLNVVPQVILQRIEIVKNGSSSIYGSDAIAGVVNFITRKRMDGLEAEFFMGVPQHGGGRQTVVSLADGWNFDSGNIMVAAQFSKQNPVEYGDRDYFRCAKDRVWGKDGQRIDRADHSIIGGTALGGCDNLYANTIMDYASDFHIRYVPSKDGHTVGPFPGYHPRPYPSTEYNDPNNPDGAYYEDVLNYPFFGSSWAINENRNSSLYLSTNFTFGTVNWFTQVLYNRRQTETHNYRQFFPYVINKADGMIYRPIMPFTSDNKVTVDYGYFRTKLSGYFTPTGSWSWEVNGSHSRSEGDYSSVGIDVRKSADLAYPAMNTVPPTNPLVDYFDPGILSGQRMNDLVAAVGIPTTGTTLYTQSMVSALFTGNLFELPAGPVSSAFGIEYRHYKIDDQPSEASRNGWLWGSTSAQVTKGADHVTEVFSEIGIPLLKGITGIESLALDLSGREFKYASVGENDNVWKIGLNWQISPTWRVRGSIGTSYRAPGLYELYLGNQSGFLAQTSIDPCVNWQDSSNTNIIAHCKAAGIPADYGGAGSSATVYQGGGKGFLKPETSRNKSLGLVWTPSFGNFNMALDYFDYHIQGEIATLDASDIVGSCYSRPVYPNRFCDLFNRNPPNSGAEANSITEVYATYININNERTRGYDLQFNFSDDFSFGRLKAQAQVTYTIEDTQQLFDSAAASGFNSTDFVGQLGRPQTVGLATVSLERGDWTYTWQGRYNSAMHWVQQDRKFEYFGYDGAIRDLKAAAQFRHSVSVAYQRNHWGATFGIRNLFDKAPDLVSGTAGIARKGNVPLVASQYDWFGRTFFLRLNYKM